MFQTVQMFASELQSEYWLDYMSSTKSNIADVVVVIVLFSEGKDRTHQSPKRIEKSGLEIDSINSKKINSILFGRIE